METEITVIEKVVAKGKEFNNVTDAMIYGTEQDLIKFCENDLYYDYGRVAANMIIENLDEIKKFVDTLANLKEMKNEKS